MNGHTAGIIFSVVIFNRAAGQPASVLFAAFIIPAKPCYPSNVMRISTVFEEHNQLIPFFWSRWVNISVPGDNRGFKSLALMTGRIVNGHGEEGSCESHHGVQHCSACSTSIPVRQVTGVKSSLPSIACWVMAVILRRYAKLAGNFITPSSA